MKVHHLNRGTMSVPTAPVVSPVLLLETGNGLVLVDSGNGPGDITDLAQRPGPARHPLRPALHPAETAARQAGQPGFSRSDIRHIVLTHLNLDHTGGPSDFPTTRLTPPQPKQPGDPLPIPAGEDALPPSPMGRGIGPNRAFGPVGQHRAAGHAGQVTVGAHGPGGRARLDEGHELPDDLDLKAGHLARPVHRPVAGASPGAHGLLGSEAGAPAGAPGGWMKTISPAGGSITTGAP